MTTPNSTFQSKCETNFDNTVSVLKKTHADSNALYAFLAIAFLTVTIGVSIVIYIFKPIYANKSVTIKILVILQVLYDIATLYTATNDTVTLFNDDNDAENDLA